MDTLNQGKEDKNKDIIENNNKNNSGNRNTKSAQFKVAFITQAAVIAALYVVLVIMFNYCSFGPIQFRIAEALTILPYFHQRRYRDCSQVVCYLTSQAVRLYGI